MTAKTDSRNKKNLIALIPTIGERQNVIDVILECKHLGLGVLIIHQGASNFEEILLERDSDTHFIHVKEKEGVSKARNIGIEYLKNVCDYEYVMILNDCTIPNLEFIEQALMVFRNHHDLDVICGACQFKSGQVAKSKSGEVRGWGFMGILEPTMMIRLSTLQMLKGFDETLGTGSKSRAQSGEGADLLFRVSKNGGRVLNLNVVASIDLRHSPSHSMKKDFGYGFGFSTVGKRHKMRFHTTLRVFTPILRYLFLERLATSPDRFLNTCAVSLGRAVGLLVPPKLVRFKDNLK